MKAEKKLAIVVSHPIQYHSPLFKSLAQKLCLKVFYCFQPTSKQQGQDGFGKAFTWDIDLLEGYEYEFLENIAQEPSSSRKDGCDTPKVGASLANYGASHVVVFGWQLKSYLQTQQYCKQHGIPIAVRGDSQIDPNQSLVKRFAKAVYFPFFLKKFDKFLSVGQRNKAYLQSFGVKEEQIIFSPHAIDQDFWSGNKTQTEACVFLWVGKFISKKRPLEVVKAFSEAAQKDDSIVLKMVGTGELLEECISLAAPCQQIQFLGFKNQTELKVEYLKGNALILASDYGETWGLVVNEAFANHLPAIVASSCGCSQDLINTDTGMTFELGKVEELTDRILQMSKAIKDSTVGERYKKGISRINETYHYRRIVDSFIEFLAAK